MDEVRCPYCVDGNAFRVMVSDVQQQDFICESCGHRVRQADATFQCSCSKCSQTRLGESRQETHRDKDQRARTTSAAHRRAAVDRLRAQIGTETDLLQLKKLVRAIAALLEEGQNDGAP